MKDQATKAWEEDSAGGQSPVVSHFEAIEVLCRGFEEQWTLDRRPDIGEFLLRTEAESRELLLRNLIEIDCRLRRGAGQSPSAGEYTSRFPEHASLVRELFLDGLSTNGLEVSDTNPTLGFSFGGRRLGKYRILRTLGRGGMGTVYEAEHVQRGTRCALKTLPQGDGQWLHQFKREFRALSGVSHANLVGLHTLESDGGQWFFTMDLVDGGDFLSHVRPGGRLDEPRLRSALAQLVAGVLALHGKHIVHRDLKPGNVMVRGDGRVILLDFGLVVELGDAWVSLTGNSVVGTPAYMAPEQAAGGRVTAACDWYAVGVMLYEALTGQRPFVGPMMQILAAKQASDPPALPEGLPADLSQLCMRLLARDPACRPNPLALASAISAAVPTVDRPAAELIEHREVALIGRPRQLAELAAALGEFRETNDPVTAFIGGRSGEGKTTLAERFLTPLRRDASLVVMSGRCYDRESVPFKAIDTLIDALASYLRSLRPEEAALAMPRDVAVLAKVFPVLQRVEAIAKAVKKRQIELDEGQTRARAFGALREMLCRISDERPVVWMVDDLQWGDADSAAAMFEVLRPPEAPAIFFLGTYRSDEKDASPFLQKFAKLQEMHAVSLARPAVEVEPFDVQQCGELMVAILGQDGEVVRRRAAEFHAETGGNPFLLTELIGCFDPSSDSFHKFELHEVLAEKLDRLPSGATVLLESVAVSGQATALAEVANAAGYAAVPMDAIARMSNERLLRLLGSEENPLVDTYHDRIRETVLRGMPAEAKRARHLAIAAVIEAGSGLSVDEAIRQAHRVDWDDGSQGLEPVPRIYDLAYHYNAAGERMAALSYSLLAAEQALKQFALQVAAEQFAAAADLVACDNEPMRYRISRGHGETMSRLGRYEDASVALAEAFSLADSDERKALLELLQSGNDFMLGNLRRSIALAESGVRRLGGWVPTGSASHLFGSLFEFIRLGLRRRGHRQPATRRDELRIQLCMRATYCHGFSRTLYTIWFSTSGVRQAEQITPSRHLARCTITQGVIFSAAGWQSMAISYIDRAMAMSAVTDDKVEAGIALGWKGVVLYAAANYQAASEIFQTAVETLEGTGEMWEANLARFHLACSYYALGDLKAAADAAQKTFKLSIRTGDPRSHCSLYLLALITDGDLPYEAMRSCIVEVPEDMLSTCNLRKADGCRLLQNGDTAAAITALEDAWAVPLRRGLINYHHAAGLAVFLRCLRTAAAAAGDAAPAQRRHHLKRAIRLTRWAAITWIFPTSRPAYLRELGLLQAERGKPRKALRILKKGCEVARRQNAAYELAMSELEAAKLSVRLNLADAQEHLVRAEAAMRPFREAIGDVKKMLQS